MTNEEGVPLYEKKEGGILGVNVWKNMTKMAFVSREIVWDNKKR